MKNFRGDFLRNILKSFKNHKRATIFLTLGLWIGTTLLTFTLSYINSLESKSKIYGVKDKDYSTFNLVNNAKIAYLEKNILVLSRDSYIDLRTSIYIDENRCDIHGIGFYDEKIYTPNTSGKFFSKDHINEDTNVAIVGKNLSNKIYKENNKSFITINNTPYEVIGVSKESYYLNSILLPMKSFLNITKNDPIMNFSWMVISPSLSLSTIKSTLGISNSPKELFIDLKNNDVYDLNTVFLMFTSIITLLVASINIVNFISIWIEERKKEIAIRKAVGGTNLLIRRMIFSEIVVLNLIALFLSFLTITIINSVINKLMILDFYMILSFKTIIISALASILLSIITALPSYKKATNIQPSIILKEE